MLVRNDLSGIAVPDAVEKQFGDASEAAAVEQSGGVFQNPQANAYINAIGQKLVSNSKRKDFGYRFAIVNDASPNAFALPNGAVYITVGLLKLLRTEAQLANVLGHEVSHVTEHHSSEQLAVNYGTIGLLSLASRVLAKKKDISKDDTAEMRNLVFGLISNGYSRKDENEADEVGQKLAAKAGWDPIGMTDVMTVFNQLEGEKSNKDTLDAYMRSHPFADERVMSANSRLKGLRQSYPNTEIGTDRYQDFLIDMLGVPESQVRLSPIQAFKDDPLLLPGAILGVGVIAFLLWALLKPRD